MAGEAIRLPRAIPPASLPSTSPTNWCRSIGQIGGPISVDISPGTRWDGCACGWVGGASWAWDVRAAWDAGGLKSRLNGLSATKSPCGDWSDPDRSATCIGTAWRSGPTRGGGSLCRSPVFVAASLAGFQYRDLPARASRSAGGAANQITRTAAPLSGARASRPRRRRRRRASRRPRRGQSGRAWWRC